MDGGKGGALGVIRIERSRQNRTAQYAVRLLFSDNRKSHRVRARIRKNGAWREASASLVSAALQQKLYPEDSAFEIVLSGVFASIGLYESPSQSVREKAVALLEEFGSIRYADRRYETLSQGEKQKVLIARALMADPELLILDEPVTGLDFIAREQVLETVEQIAKKDSAPSMLYVTHHAEEILPAFSQTLLLKKGEVFALGKTREMMSGEVLSEFFDMPVQAVWTEDRPYLSKKKTANLNV